MEFWSASIVADGLTIVALLAVATLVSRTSRRVRRIGVPDAILAGLLGLLLGPSALDVLPSSTDGLELVIYHAFAVVFIAVGLQSTPRSNARGAAASMAVAIPTMGVLQAILGFAFVAVWAAVAGESLHPAFGWMVTLGFMQGPGQALALGSAWEQHGLAQGAQIGLVFAALGFFYCVLLGVPLVAFARRRGWIDPPQDEPDDDLPATTIAAPASSPEASHGAEPLTVQLLLVGVAYIGVFAVLSGVTRLLPEASPIRGTLWGFHFIVGAGIAIAMRRSARRLRLDAPFDDGLLARVSVVAVDVATAGAIAAVRLDVMGRWLVPILVVTAIAGALTLLACVWVARRIFPEQPFSHALVLLGASTGTISTGLALLRMVDPSLKGPVARNVIVAATAAVPLGAPLFLALIPFSVGLWSYGLTTAVMWPLLLLLVYFAALVVAFRVLTPARWHRPFVSLWPTARERP